MRNEPLLLAAFVVVVAGPVGAQDAQSCKLCHQAIYEEWKESMHAKAWTDPIFQRVLEERGKAGEPIENCKPCHIPEPILATGLGKLPTARTEYLEEGVTCITCHKGEGGYHGPFEAKRDTDRLKYVHGSVRNPAFRTHEVCTSCHGIAEVPAHDQTTSFLEGPFSSSGGSCQKCHMPWVERPTARRDLYPSLPDRPGGMHRWPGSSSLEQLRLALLVESRIEEGVAIVSLRNMAGHLVPPTAGRVLTLECVFDSGRREEVVFSMETKHRLPSGEVTESLFPLEERESSVTVRLLHRRMPFLDPVVVDEVVTGR